MTLRRIERGRYVTDDPTRGLTHEKFSAIREALGLEHTHDITGTNIEYAHIESCDYLTDALDLVGWSENWFIQGDAHEHAIRAISFEWGVIR